MSDPIAGETGIRIAFINPEFLATYVQKFHDFFATDL